MKLNKDEKVNILSGCEVEISRSIQNEFDGLKSIEFKPIDSITLRKASIS